MFRDGGDDIGHILSGGEGGLSDRRQQVELATRGSDNTEVPGVEAHNLVRVGTAITTPLGHVRVVRVRLVGDDGGVVRQGHVQLDLSTAVHVRPHFLDLQLCVVSEIFFGVGGVEHVHGDVVG
ncbi:hypothetical protein PPTG_24178 [Phytophthora nicotianae INRA-310]|uniref:Uncharacterized protein n=1 Tax=Phytophthora nicotianae (strain INRA-310) TaxID=761204 RepID=W2PIJ3_PHYN3|nr:hypothetical protein PPTG_24178 [Phytophthora nicotianae INRA-310]ETN00798.1 hypothetical protein PPTG_24178 [Phytophthora nicotianae INRA-310]